MFKYIRENERIQTRNMYFVMYKLGKISELNVKKKKKGPDAYIVEP